MRARVPSMVVAVVLALETPGFASAPDAAERAFAEGVARMKAGRHEEACPLVAESHRLDPRPGTLFTLAECEALRGRIATASRLYGAFLEMIGALPPGKRARYRPRAQIAEAQRISLGARIPELTLVLPADAPAGTVVERDGERIAGAMRDAPMALDPGDHEIVTQTPEGLRARVVVRLGAGEKKTVTLEVKKAPVIAPPAPVRLALAPPPLAPREPVSARRIATYGAIGIGAAGLLTGTICGALAIREAGVVHRECSGSACTPAGKGAADAASRLGAASTIGFGVGLAGAGAALVLRLTEPKRAGSSVRVGVTASGLAIEGAW